MSSQPNLAPRVIEEVFRDVYGHAVASLVRVFGDLSVAEDAVQDAFVVASTRWPADGIPPNPHGWIVSTARYRGIDRVRRTGRGRELEKEATDLAALDEQDSTMIDPAQPIEDDRLRLIFTCCHPALRPEHQVALTLKLMGGLSVEEIGHGFLVSEAAMAKRITRAKYKIAAANVPYRIPPAAELPDRLDPVLSVLYLIYNAGNARDLLDPFRIEAIRLARAVVDLLPGEPEPAGLLALMVLNESRVKARHNADGPVLLRDQERRRWDRSMIVEGQGIVRWCIEIGRPGPYQLQAAIQAVHCNAAAFTDTDWPQIVELYDHLLELAPSPVTALNRAIAVMERDGPAAGLELFAGLAEPLDGYAPFHAAIATALARQGDAPRAADAFTRAAALATDATSKAQLERFAADPIGRAG